MQNRQFNTVGALLMKPVLFLAAVTAALFSAAAHAQAPPAVVVPLPSGPAGPVFTIEYNTDLVGGDLRPGFPVSDIGKCMDACVEDSACQAFAFVKPHEQMPRRDNASPICWLKGSVPNKLKNPGIISGIKH
jgi:hypothetical protein